MSRPTPVGSGPVLVVGRGATGEAVVHHLDAVEVAYTVVDDEERAAGAAGAGRPGWRADEVDALLAAHALVVPSPGVPEHHPILAGAHARGIPVRSELDFGAAATAVPLVAVTGTNGKTTVTTLVTAMLEASGLRAVATGNIGRPLLAAVDAEATTGAPDVYVVEVSSFQLRFTTAFRPHVAVWTNVASDHLDWHGSFDAYVQAKAAITARQTAADVLVVDARDDEVARATATSRATRVLVDETGSQPRAWRAVDGRLVDPEGAAVLDLAPLDLVAPHEVRNLAMAAAAARAAGASPAGIAAGARATPRLHHRMELVGHAGGVRWINDSKATNPHATVAAVGAFDSVVLVAGGHNKGLDLSVLRPLAPRLRHVVAIGAAAPEVADAFAGATPVTTASSMAEAVDAAARAARPGDVVLLSPACASFDWYSGYPARGDDFRAEVERHLGAGAEVAGAAEPPA